MMPRLDPTGVVLTQVNQCLAKELSDAQNLITSQDKMFENLAEKMSQVSIRNVNTGADPGLRRRGGQNAKCARMAHENLRTRPLRQ